MLRLGNLQHGKSTVYTQSDTWRTKDIMLYAFIITMLLLDIRARRVRKSPQCFWIQRIVPYRIRNEM